MLPVNLDPSVVCCGKSYETVSKTHLLSFCEGLGLFFQNRNKVILI